jgi:hypothetical protein
MSCSSGYTVVVGYWVEVLAHFEPGWSKKKGGFRWYKRGFV